MYWPDFFNFICLSKHSTVRVIYVQRFLIQKIKKICQRIQLLQGLFKTLNLLGKHVHIVQIVIIIVNLVVFYHKYLRQSQKIKPVIAPLL